MHSFCILISLSESFPLDLNFCTQTNNEATFRKWHHHYHPQFHCHQMVSLSINSLQFLNAIQNHKLMLIRDATQKKTTFVVAHKKTHIFQVYIILWIMRFFLFFCHRKYFVCFRFFHFWEQLSDSIKSFQLVLHNILTVSLRNIIFKTSNSWNT